MDKNGARQPYTGADRGDITIHRELNKLASNIGLGRDFAGVHYRSDYLNSVFLGEQVAITLLEDQNCTYNEKYKISFKKFDGKTTYTLNKSNSGPC